jgi:hypothetical protein
MTQRADIAFASFHFQVTEAAPREFTGAEYLKWIEDALGAIATVTDIDISAQKTYRQSEFERPDAEELRSLTELHWNIPGLQFVVICFNIHIPRRFQDELIGRGFGVDPALGEDFSLVLSDGWQTSLAMVRPISGIDSDAADAVIVAREFLEREFERLGERPISFQCLGPSPAHLRVTVSDSDEASGSDFERASHSVRGYDNYVFRTSLIFESEEEMCMAFFGRVRGELDLLYRMAVARSRQISHWNDALNGTMSILQAYKRHGIRGWLARLWQGRNLRSALISLGEVELTQQEDKQEFDRNIHATYDVGRGLLVEVNRKNLHELEPRPIAPLSSLLQLLDASRHTGRDVLIASVASLFGAAVAAAATLIAAH